MNEILYSVSYSDKSRNAISCNSIEQNERFFIYKNTLNLLAFSATDKSATNRKLRIDMKYLFAAIAILITSALSLKAQDQMQTFDGNEAFFFDAMVFKGTDADSSRIDSYFMIPYQTLNFNKSGDFYVSKYQAIISVFDSLGSKVAGASVSREISETDFNTAQGGTAKFDVLQLIVNLKAGSYRIRATIVDEFARKEYNLSRTINVIDYSKFPLSMSALMLVSSIEEVNGRYKITPHISDNIGNLKDGFFTFFEVYNFTEEKEVDLLYQIFEGDNLIASGTRTRKQLKEGTNRVYMRVAKPASIGNTGFILRIITLKPADDEDYEVEDVLALAQRSIKSITRMGGLVMNDINKSIRQLRYVANQQELDYIQAGNSDDEKIKRFEEFWKQLDPTPATERNEAFDEYFRRVAIANKNFRSYTEGWMTDKGMVYIIFGPPFSSEKSSYYNDGRVYERWTYQNNREFIFADNTGFGDFRLVRPITVVEKYRYE